MASRLVWVAVTTIWQKNTRAFNRGDVVPDSVEARWDYAAQGLVARQLVDDNESPDLGDTGVAFRDEVVLREDLHIGDTPPTSPAVGTVWIDTSL